MKKLCLIVLGILSLVTGFNLGSWAGSATTHGYFYKPDYGEKGPTAYSRYNAALDATDLTLYGLEGLGALVSNWAIEDQIVTLIPVTCTYSDADTFTLPGDYTSRFAVGAVVQVQVAAGMVYSTVASSSYAAPTTTVNLNDAVLTNPITRVYVVATRDGLWPNGPGYVVARDYGTSRANLATADAVAVAAGKALYITYPYNIDDDMILSAKQIICSPEAILAIATTKTLTINGTLEAGRYQIFSCTGTGAVTGLKEAHPEWFGTGAAALQSCMNSCQTTVLTEGTTYSYSGAGLYPPEDHTIVSTGPGAILHRTDIGCALYPYNNVTLRNFTLQGDGGSTYTAGANGITILYNSGGWVDPGGVVGRDQTDSSKWRGWGLVVENVIIKDFAANGMGAGPWSIIKDVVIQDTLCEGMLIPGDYVQIVNPNIRNVPGWGIDIIASHNTVIGGYLYNCGDETAFTGDMGGIIINSSTQSAGTIGNKINGTTIDTTDGIGVLVYAPETTDYTLTDTVLSNLIVKNTCVDAAGDVCGIIVRDNTTSGTKLRRVNIDNVIVNGVTTGHGIGIFGAKEVNIDNYHIEAVASKGILLYDGAVGTWDSINIGKGTIKNCGTDGIYAYHGTRLNIADYNISDSTAVAPYFGINLAAVTKFNIGQGIIDLDVTNGYGLYITTTSGHGAVKGANIANCLAGIYDDSTGGYITKTGNELSDTNTTALAETGTRTGCFSGMNIGVAMPEYVNNAAAVAGGKVAGEFYKITGADTLGVVH